MKNAKIKFYQVESVNPGLVRLKLADHYMDLLTADFPWKVAVGDRVCIKDGFIHSKVPAVIGSSYVASLLA